MVSYVVLRPASSQNFKWMIERPDGKTVRFGDVRYEDYTIHKDTQRKQRYLARHKKRENWTIGGVSTAGFWSRWLLWNKPSVTQSIKDIEERFGIRVVRA